MAEKQQKVLNKINKKSQTSQNIHKLKLKPNDECYTSMQDILNELQPWADLGKFQGKNIICPCDWDIVEGKDIYSIKINYNETGVNVLGNDVKKIEVVYNLWDEENNQITIKLKEDEIEEFLRDKLTCNFIRTFAQNARAWGIKSITASGYNPANGKGVRFQDVDYSEYDICVTNPPFSLYGEFMKCIIDKIDFIVLAPFLNRVNPCIGLPLMLKKAYLGFNYYLQLNFINPNTQNEYMKKAVCCDWITSFNDAAQSRNSEHYKTGIKYDLYKDDFSYMENMIMKDGTKALRVTGTTYPEDYNGWMFAPGNVLNKLDTSIYEWQLSEARTYYKNNPDKYPYLNTYDMNFYISGGKKYFLGIVFRKKPEVKK